jgi:hypothetical protein
MNVNEKIQNKNELANELLKIAGIREIGEEQFYIVNFDIREKKEEIMQLLPYVCKLLSIPERRPLYKINQLKHPEMALVRCVLSSVGHPLSRTQYPYPQSDTCITKWKHAYKYLLDRSLLLSSSTNPLPVIFSQPVCASHIVDKESIKILEEQRKFTKQNESSFNEIK